MKLIFWWHLLISSGENCLTLIHTKTCKSFKFIYLFMYKSIYKVTITNQPLMRGEKTYLGQCYLSPLQSIPLVT